jgi:hypothetical protein
MKTLFLPLLCSFLLSCGAVTAPKILSPIIEVVYNSNTGDYLEVRTDKNGLTITGKNLRTGETWFKRNQTNGKFYGYDKNQDLFYGDRNTNQLVKFPAFKSEFTN